MLMVEETYLLLALTARGLTDAQFEELCHQYKAYRVEYTAEREIIVMPPTDPRTGMRNSAIDAQLWLWASKDGRSGVTDSSAGFALPDGSRLSPDAAWISRGRLGRRPVWDPAA
ncbi:MAG: Uma2 family endonuclease [Bryobacteraceae bacterium]